MKLLDHLKENFGMKNDADIARTLNIAPPIVSRIRNGKSNVSAEIILRIHEAFEMPIKDIKALL